jgi:hypothetical protein
MEEKMHSMVEVVMCPVAQIVEMDKSHVDSSSSRRTESGIFS